MADTPTPIVALPSAQTRPEDALPYLTAALNNDDQAGTTGVIVVRTNAAGDIDLKFFGINTRGSMSLTAGILLREASEPDDTEVRISR